MSVSSVDFSDLLATCSPHMCRKQICCQNDSKIPVSSSGSAAVFERKYSAYLLLWSAVQLLSGARSLLYHNRCLLPKQHVSTFFTFHRLCVYPWVGFLNLFLACSSFCFLGLSALLSCRFCFLVVSALLSLLRY